MNENLINQEQESHSLSYKDSLDMMSRVAQNKQDIDDIRMLTSSKVTDQLKVFLLSQARNELFRVIKLTQFLDKIENSFISKVNTEIDNDALTLKQYSDIIAVITSLLSRSNEIINNVLEDDSLTTILNTTIYTNDYGQSTSVVTNLKDAQSREKVRKVIQQIINKADNYVTEAEYTEVKEDDVNE